MEVKDVDFVMGDRGLVKPVDNWMRGRFGMYRNCDKSARCKEQVKLAEGVIIASAKVRQAQVDVDEAKEAKLDTRTSSAMLHNARKEGRQALVALGVHTEGHQCRDTSS
jgi:hypothetical protein